MPRRSQQRTPSHWARVAVNLSAFVGITFACWYAALWLFPLPPLGTNTGPAAEEVTRALWIWWWKFYALYLAVSVIVYGLAPPLWRHLSARGARHGEVAG
jgi:hypothetical protein